MCGTLICENEPAECKDPNIFDQSDCAYSSIPFYCPVLCGKCPKTTTTTLTTLQTTTQCPIKLNCLNGAKQNQNTCLCDCTN